MNIEQAKQIPLEDFLRRLGYEPSRKTHYQLWYLSPFRGEKTPSFKVNPRLNAWYDFGKGEGGDILDLVKQLDGLSSVSDALARIEELVGLSPLPVRSAIPVARQEAAPPVLELTSISPVTSKSLLAYLRNRCIDPKAVTAYAREAHYRRGDDTYFALAFANNSGGYELRNQGFKGTLGSKDITTIGGNPSRMLVFEGFFDFLTSLALRGGTIDSTVIVLNSVAMREKAIAAIRQLNPRTIELYRDNDAAGEQLLETFRNALPGIEIIDKSELYAGHNDLNDWYAKRELANCIG